MRPTIYFKEEPCERAKEILLEYFRKISIGSYPVDVIWTGLKQTHPAKGTVVATPCTGTDHVTADTIIHLDDEFKEYVGYKVTSTAEHTLSLMLQLAKKARIQLNGKVVGIIGLGRIGSMVADYCMALGMKVLTYDIKGHGNCNLAELLEYSDVISIHIPLENNRVFIDGLNIGKMKENVLLINTSRRDVVGFGTITHLIEQNSIFYADDFSDPNTDLISDRFISTSHIAGNSVEAREITDIWLANKLIRYWRSRTHENKNS